MYVKNKKNYLFKNQSKNVIIIVVIYLLKPLKFSQIYNHNCIIFLKVSFYVNIR